MLFFPSLCRLFALVGLLLPAAIFFASGCTSMWNGVTMKQVEKARGGGLSRTVPAPLRIAAQGVVNAATERQMLVFVDDLPRRLMLLHVPGCNNTTEVGVFFTALSPTETKVEIASPSDSVRDRAAAILFPALEKAFAGSQTLTPAERITAP